MVNRKSARKALDPIAAGRRIAFLRAARGLSQTDLARKMVELGASGTITKSSVSKWETAQTDPTAIENVTMYFLLKVLGTTHEFVLFGPDVGAAPDEAAAAAKPHR